MSAIRINQSNDIRAEDKVCNVCGLRDEDLLKRCGRCLFVMYCGPEHQKADWPKHKLVCVQSTGTENVVRMKSTHIEDGYALSSFQKKPSQITEEQKQEIQQIIALPLDSILTDRNTEQLTKELGQKWFDKYKEQAGGDSMAGKRAVQNMCNAIASNTTESKKNAKLRMEYVEHVWGGESYGAGIGDTNWSWLA